MILFFVYLSQEITTPKPPHIYTYVLHVDIFTEALYRCEFPVDVS